MRSFILTIVDLPRPAISTCSVNSMPGRSLDGSSDSLGVSDKEARGTNRFHCGQVEVFTRASRMSCG